jgi:hypothetical protein
MSVSPISRIVPLLLLVGCLEAGAEPEASAPPLAEDDDVVASVVESKLVAGAALNASQDLVPDSTRESETASVVLDFPAGTTRGLAVAFNSVDAAHTSGSNVCKGYSQSALSYGFNGVFHGLRFAVPPNLGVSMYSGDPAVAVTTLSGYWLVYVSTLAISDATWNKKATGTNSCIARASLPDPDRACISVALISADGSAVLPLSGYGGCVGSAGIDGGALYFSPATNSLYAAYFNDTLKSVDVFKNGSKIQPPFSSLIMQGHPKFPHTLSADTIPTVVAADSAGRFRVARLDEQNGQWTNALITSASAPPYDFYDDVALRNGLSVRQTGFTVDSYQELPGGQDFLWLFYSVKNSGPKRLQGVRVLFQGMNVIESSVLPNATTPSGSTALLPEVTAVNVSGRPTDIGFRPWLSYWSDEGQPAGAFKMVMAKVSRQDGSLTRFDVGPVETVCPTGIRYWGDYDSFVVWNNGSSQPTLLRYLTDSTAATCNGSGDPQHVSVVAGNGAL